MDSVKLHVHQVPYCSQWESAQLVPLIVSGVMRAIDDPLWAQSGASSPAEYEFWSGRICGVACLRMVLAHWCGINPPLVSLAKECLEAGAYIRRHGYVEGLIYAPFCAYVRSRWGLEADSHSILPVDQLPGYLEAGRLVMISVHHTIRDAHTTPSRRGGHLVLAVGVTAEHLIIHNPSGFPNASQQFAPVPWCNLERFYAGRGIVFHPPR